LPFELLSDSDYRMKQLLHFPTFEVAGMELYKRMTLIALGGKIQKVFYPVFPPDQNAIEVIAWLSKNARQDATGDAKNPLA
jgi:peroxiredoxin